MGTLGTPTQSVGGVSPNVIIPLGDFPGDTPDSRRRLKSMPTSDAKEIREARQTIRRLKRAMRDIREAIDNSDQHIEHEEAEIRESRRKGRYTRKEMREVNREKESRYGTDEVFAVPSLHSYPLTKDGKPSRERVESAWKYIHQGENMSKLGLDAVRAAEKRIVSFAKKYFDIELHDKHNKNRNPAQGSDTHVLGETPVTPAGNEDSQQLEEMRRGLKVKDLIKPGGTHAVDEAILQVFSDSDVHDVIEDLRRELEDTSNTRDMATLQQRAYITDVLARLSHELQLHKHTPGK
jgi:hypothetical protein